METTFITVHDLSPDARIQYISDTVEDILGYTPNEVRNRSCWDYFHPEEVPFARDVHGRGVELDKAAVLNYARIKHKDGSWVSCECVFTIVYDVLVACTSIYRRSLRSQQRAIKAPAIRRIFSSSPKDPRYHMLTYLSRKFTTPAASLSHEPRAALFINRFTRTSTIMFATSGVSEILGMEPNQIVSKSFYFCIAENCLQDAVRCVERAKANDSIAYLRFWFRNPLDRERRASRSSDEDEDEGGVQLSAREPGSPPASNSATTSAAAGLPNQETRVDRANGANGQNQHEPTSHSSSNTSGEDVDGHREGDFDRPELPAISSTSSIEAQGETPLAQEAIELEAVVSCTSDGLVVILRKAQPIPEGAISPPTPLDYDNGVFMSPWAPEPILPSDARDQVPEAFGLSAAPQTAGPTSAKFMSSIRSMGVFAWGLVGINGSLTDLSRGKPADEALPPDGVPIWDASAPVSDERFNGFAENSHRRISDEEMKELSSTSGEDEIVYRRTSNMPPWRPVQRRGRQEAFGENDDSEVDDMNNLGSRRRKLDH